MHRIASGGLTVALAASFLLAAVAPAATAGTGQSTAAALLDVLPVAAPVTTGYERTLFTHWIDADGDGCDTRAEVLIAESLDPVTRTGTCVITGGRWLSWYDGATWTDPADVDIDHFVPLGEAWASGANVWTPAQRTAYANDLGFADSLWAVTDNVNQSKGDRDPAAWLPPDASQYCRYATDWVEVKYRWRLAMDPDERTRLASILSGACGDTVLALPDLADVPDTVSDLDPTSPMDPDPTTTQKTVYRFWSQTGRSHFYTMSVAERDHIIASYPTSVWNYEGPVYQAYDAQRPGTVPLYRFWSTRFQGHFYTTSESEKDTVIRTYDAATWSYEGVAFYVLPSGTDAQGARPVARFWSDLYRHHFYTADAAETQVVKGYPQNEWRFEGETFSVPRDVALVIPSTPAPYQPPVQQPSPPPAPPAPPASNVVKAGSFCSTAGAMGVSSTGKRMVCAVASDGRLRWHTA